MSTVAKPFTLVLITVVLAVLGSIGILQVFAEGTGDQTEPNDSAAVPLESDSPVSKQLVQVQLSATEAPKNSRQKRLDDVKKLTPRKIREGDVLAIWCANTLPGNEIKGLYKVDSLGKVALGPMYGRVEVKGLNVEHAEIHIREHLRKYLSEVSVMVTFDALPGQAIATVAAIDSNAPVVAGESLRIRVGSKRSFECLIDEVIQVERPGTLPLPPPLRRMHIDGMTPATIEKHIEDSLAGIVSSPTVRVTRSVAKDAESELDKIKSELRVISKKLDSLD